MSPALEFAATLRWSASVGKLAVYVTFALLLGFVLVPRVQRVSSLTANALLSLALLALACNSIWAEPIRCAIASSIGLFDGVAPVAEDGESPKNTVSFAHPAAGYRVGIPRHWVREDMPALGLTQFCATARTRARSSVRTAMPSSRPSRCGYSTR